MGSPMSEGHLASFVFTCKAEGDVTLELVTGDKAKLESILIHQNDPNLGEGRSGDGGEQMQGMSQEDVDEMLTFLEEVLLEEVKGTPEEEELKEFIEGMKDLYK